MHVLLCANKINLTCATRQLHRKDMVHVIIHVTVVTSDDVWFLKRKSKPLQRR